MSSLNIGQCGICETVILEKNKRGSYSPNSKYSEIVLSFSNGMVGRHGVCSDCAGSLTPKKITNLTERIKSTWADQLVGSGNKNQFDKLKEVTTVAYGHQREEVVKQAKEIKESARIKTLTKKK